MGNIFLSAVGRVGMMFLFFISSLIWQNIQAQSPQDTFGSFLDYNDNVNCISGEQRAEIRKTLKTNIAKYGSSINGRTQKIGLIFPIRQGANFDDEGFFAISNFVDLNSNFPNQVEDHNCGKRSYDTNAGYNHTGTDYFSFPFSWKKMKDNHVEVIAAASGTIIFKEADRPDKSCEFNDSPWNAVYVTHDDGSIAWYGHLKTGSLTTKKLGDRVEQGEYLGIMGSSGNSTSPHLHFELFDDSNKLIDPYLGPCNNTTTETWWEESQPYQEPGINALMTHTEAPVVFGCSTDEKPSIENNFVSGQKAFFATYFRDQLEGITSSHRILKPNGEVFTNWQTTPSQYRNGTFWFRSFDLPSSGDMGKWTFEVTYMGVTHQHYFYLTSQATSSLELSTDVLSFDNINSGVRTTQSFFIKNTGQNAVWVDNITYSDGASGSWSGSIDTNESKEIKVDLVPKNNLDYIGELVIKTNSDPEERKIIIQGTQEIRSRTLVLQSEVDFGMVTVSESATRTVRIQNDGNDMIDVTNVIYPEGVTGEKNFTINPGSVKNLAVTATSISPGVVDDKVEIESNASSGAMSFNVKVEFIGAITGLLEEEDDLVIYPNPVTNDILQIDNIQSSQIWILDLTGKVVLVDFSLADSISLNVANLFSGIYIVRVFKSDQVITKRIQID